LQFGALENGLRFSAELDLPTRRLIRELDGSRTLQEALAAVADVDVMRESGLSFRILERGFPELGRLSADREPDPFGRLTRLWR
jgi:hypothetical protein